MFFLLLATFYLWRKGGEGEDLFSIVDSFFGARMMNEYVWQWISYWFVMHLWPWGTIFGAWGFLNVFGSFGECMISCLKEGEKKSRSSSSYGSYCATCNSSYWPNRSSRDDNHYSLSGRWILMLFGVSQKRFIIRMQDANQASPRPDSPVPSTVFDRSLSVSWSGVEGKP